MESLFLDTNSFIDLVEARDASFQKKVSGFALYISAVTIGTWLYIYKRKVPNDNLLKILETFNVVNTSNELILASCLGPTADYEDNLQLHSAVAAECGTFLTKDAVLLKLGNFGKIRVVDSIKNH